MAVVSGNRVLSGGMRVVVVVVDFVMVLVCERGTWTARVFVGLSACLIGAEVWGCLHPSKLHSNNAVDTVGYRNNVSLHAICLV